MRKILFAAIALASGVAYGADVRVTCTAPTQYTDGSVIPAGVLSYRLYGGRTGQPKTQLGEAENCGFTRTGLLPGQSWDYYVTAVAGGQESGASPLASVTIPDVPKVPGAPTGTTVVTITVGVSP